MQISYEAQLKVEGLFTLDGKRDNRFLRDTDGNLIAVVVGERNAIEAIRDHLIEKLGDQIGEIITDFAIIRE